MARSSRTTSPQHSSQPSEGAEASTIRGPDGRFRGCGNPSGRPKKKESAHVAELLFAVLHEKIGGSGAGPSMPMIEALVRRLCVKAADNPNLTLKLIDIMGRWPAEAKSPAEEAEDDDAILAGYRARQERRGSTRDAENASAPDVGEADE